MVLKGILERKGRGVYKIGKTTIFVPHLDNKAKSIYKKIISKFSVQYRLCVGYVVVE